MVSYTPTKNEVLFELRPIGVKYICEFCNEGEQIAVTNEPIVVPMTTGQNGPILRKHRCNKCGKTMMLPKTYPYIEWVEVDPPVLDQGGVSYPNGSAELHPSNEPIPC